MEQWLLSLSFTSLFTFSLIFDSLYLFARFVTQSLSSSLLHPLSWCTDFPFGFVIHCLFSSSSLYPLSRFVTIYRGPSHTYKVQRLTESSSYSFRIQAISDAGEGPFSDTHTFCTTKSVPPALKGKLTQAKCVFCCMTDVTAALQDPPVCKSSAKFVCKIPFFVPTS